MNESSGGLLRYRKPHRQISPGRIPRGVLAGAAWVLLAGGCTTALDTADSRFEAGDYQAATSAYESSLAAAESNGGGAEPCGEPLFRLALAYSLPSSVVREPDRATELLKTLAERCPEGPWGEAARMLLGDAAERRRLLGEVTVERARADALETRIGKLDSLRARADDARAAEARNEAELSGEIDKLRRQITELREQIEERDRRLLELENELRRIKDIDLQ